MTEQTAREVLGLLLTLASLGVAAVAYVAAEWMDRRADRKRVN